MESGKWYHFLYIFKAILQRFNRQYKFNILYEFHRAAKKSENYKMKKKKHAHSGIRTNNDPINIPILYHKARKIIYWRSLKSKVCNARSIFLKVPCGHIK